MADNKANQLLDAISIVADSVVKSYAYDQTIEAKVLSTARKDQGIYKCEYENAIFDAYSSDTQSYYENEVVYVNIPKGDFSKQKHIIGRKVDLEAAPDRTFNFRMPFDDFVGLESLTVDSPYTRDDSRGFLANYARHGQKLDVDPGYLAAIRANQAGVKAIEDQYMTNLTQLTAKYNDMKNRLTDSQLQIYGIILTATESRLNLKQYNSNQTYLYALIDAYENGNLTQIDALFNGFVEAVDANAKTNVAIGQEDKTKLLAAADKYYKFESESLKAQYISDRNVAVQQMDSKMSQYQKANYNHLWSWVNTAEESKPLVETKLGVSLDIRSDLGQYFPQQGEYGVRIEITGITKPTEEEASATKTIEVLWTNDQMYGNTYAFYTPYTQQRIIDISGFLSLDRIDMYFYQNTTSTYEEGYFYSNKTGANDSVVGDVEPVAVVNGLNKYQKIRANNFISDRNEVIPFTYTDSNGNEMLLPCNIFYSNLKVFLGLTTDECQTDRVILYTYDDVMYGEDPFDPTARSAKDTRELKFAWVHKMDSGDIVLVDHVQKNNENDNRALEAYDAQIYWYHYLYGAEQDTSQLVYKYAGVNWEFLEDAKATLERTTTTFNETTMQYETVTERYDSYCKFDLLVQPDITRAKEKWKVGVICNSVPYMSSPLVFTNVDGGIETEGEQINQVAFRILREGLDNKGNRVIKEDNSLTNFYVYDEQGYTIENDENLNWADLWFYVQVWIRNNDDGSYTPLALAIDEDNWDANAFEIQWQLPTTNSMLSDITTVTNAELENAVLAPTVGSNVEGLNEAIRSCTRKFKIKRKWDMRAINNTIGAIVKRNGRIFKPQQEFLFGQSSGMGSPFQVGIIQDKPENGNMIEGEEFSLRAVVYDSTGTESPNKNYFFRWELLSPTIVTAGKLDPINGLTWKTAFEQMTFEDDGKGNIQNVFKGYIRNAYPMLIRVEVTGAADYPISQTMGFSLVDNSLVNSNYRVSCPRKIEFRSDGKMPLTVNSVFEVRRIVEGTGEQLIHPDWELHQYQLLSGEYVEMLPNQIECIGLKTTTTPQINLVSNLNPTVYVAKPNGKYNFDAGFTTTADSTHTEANAYDAVKTAIKAAYDTDLENLESSDPDVIAPYTETYQERLNALNRAISAYVPSYTSYAIDPYINYSPGKKAPWQWSDRLKNELYTVIQYTNGGYYYKQAIAFTRNVYSSSLLNSWDGSELELDNKNAAVLAKMISAGAKDNDNRFTGVVMGNWAKNADTSLEIPGLYGLLSGEQVFGFKTDGTGFIGKNGKGRIQFDGNKSLISNYDETCYINLDPVKYDFSSGGLTNLSNYAGYSQYFLFAKTPKTTTLKTPNDDYESLTQSTYWANDFLNDATNDYFVVDPNNGVLTTGGVIARYGKIGNWMISQTGLYQRHNAGVAEPETANRYMYLGYAGLSASDLDAINAQFADLYAALETRYQNALASARAKYKMEEFKVVGKYYANIFNYDPMHYYNYGWPYESFTSALSDTIDTFSARSNLNFEQKQIVLSTNLIHYIEAEERTGYHWHYRNGVKYGNPQYTGDATEFGRMVYGMSVSEPSMTALQREQAATSNTYPDGLHRTVTFNLTVSTDTTPGTGSSIHGETYSMDRIDGTGVRILVQAAKNIPSGISATNYYSVLSFDSATSQYYVGRVYQQSNQPIKFYLSESGYDSAAAAEAALQAAHSSGALDDNVGGNIVFAIINNASKFYVASDIIIYPYEPKSNSDENDGGEQDDGSYKSNARQIPASATSGSYYAEHPRNSDDKYWRDCWQQYLPDWTPTGDDRTPYCFSIDIRATKDLGTEHLQHVLTYAQAYNKYTLDSYLAQLEEMLAAGLTHLTEEQYAAYLVEKAKQEAALAAYIRDVIDPMFATMRGRLDERKAKAINDKLQQTDDRYAIFAGYTPTSVPLFSVNWRGYMTARAGKIGYESPWYVSDQGLTQTNNFGTIFLGNPMARSDKTGWADNLTDLENVTTLPNDTKIYQDANGQDLPDNRGPYVLGASDNTASYGGFAIYAGNKGYIWTYDQNLDKYTRSAESKASIKFGVRMDGTLYAITGCIGGWYITQNMMYAGDPTGNGDFVVLDANRGVINLNNAVILDKTGTVYLGKLNEQGETAGDIHIAGVTFKGRTTGTASYSPHSFALSTDSLQMMAQTEYKFWSVKKTLAEKSIATGSTTPATMAKSLAFSALLDINNGDASRPTGITIAFGHETNADDPNDDSKHAVAIYPTTLTTENSVLGTAEHPWDMVADTILCNTLDVTAGNLSAKNMFMGEMDDGTQKWHLVATQFWVRQQLQDVYAKIKDASEGGSGGSNRSYGGCGSLAKSISALEQLLAQMINGTDFLQSNDGTATIELKDSALVFKVSKYEITAWTDPVISEGESDTVATGTGNIVDEGSYTIGLSGWRISWRYGYGTGQSIYDVIKSINSSFDENGLKGTIEGTTLSWALKTSGSDDDSAGINAAWTADLSHNHALTFQEPTGAPGTVSFEIGEANFPPAAEGNSATFDVAATTWYKSQVLKPMGTDTTTHVPVIGLYLSSSDDTYMNHNMAFTLTEVVADKKVTVSTGGNQFGEVSTAATYNAGYAAACITDFSDAGVLTFPVMTSQGAPSSDTSTMSITMEAGSGDNAGKHRPKVTIKGKTFYGDYVGTYEAGKAAGEASVTASSITFSTDWSSTAQSASTTGSDRSITGGQTRYLKVTASLNDTSRSIRVKVTASDSSSDDE